MGLDVTLLDDGLQVYWSNSVMQDFPFEKRRESYASYDDYGVEEEYVSEFVSEICGMDTVGAVSFRGRGYSDFCSSIKEIPYSFYSDLSPEALAEQSAAFAAYLVQFENQSDDLKLPGGETLREIRNLSKLLIWAAGHGLGTSASY